MAEHSVRGAAEAIATLRAAGCVFAEEEAALLLAAAETDEQLSELVQHRADGAPLEHVLGWAEFCGLRIAVGPGVFVPRRRSEALVRTAVGLTAANALVVDMCCGAGGIGAAMLAARPAVTLYACDIEPAALRWAEQNLGGTTAVVLHGDLYDALPNDVRGHVDVLVANVPYVPTADIATMPAEARVHEPRRALDGGADGLDVFRKLVSGVHEWLAPGGSILIEAAEHQLDVARAVLGRAGLQALVCADDEADALVVVGTSAPPAPRT